MLKKIWVLLLLTNACLVYCAELACTGGTAPSITSLTANPSSVNSGESSTILWDLSNDVSSCIKSGDWSGAITGSDVSNGIHASIVANITTNKTFNLQCSNANGITSLYTANVIIAPSGCSAPILGENKDLTIVANGTPSAGAFDGSFSNLSGTNDPWPAFGNTQGLSLTKDQYISASFITGTLNLSGRLSFANPGNNQGFPSNTTTVVINECPGDFNINQPTCKSTFVGNNGSLGWSTDPIANPSQFCILNKNTEYYLNIVHSDNSEGDNFATSDCSQSYCGIIFVNQAQ